MKMFLIYGLLLDPSSKLFIIAFTLSFPKQNGTMPKNVSSVLYSMFLQVTKKQKMVDCFYHGLMMNSILQ